MSISMKRALGGAFALSLGLALAGCGDMPNNPTLYSVKQPVVERSNFTLDLATSSSGLPINEQRRLDDWFETLDLGYGDRIAIDDAVASDAVREDVAAIAGRYGLLLAEGAPVTEGYVDPGNVRVIVSRSTASVPGCPDWSDGYGGNYDNTTADNFGCATNSNLAAMVADPQHLIEGAEGTGETTVMSSTKAIETYRAQEPSGAGGLAETSSQGE